MRQQYHHRGFGGRAAHQDYARKLAVERRRGNTMSYGGGGDGIGAALLVFFIGIPIVTGLYLSLKLIFVTILHYVVFPMDAGYVYFFHLLF